MQENSIAAVPVSGATVTAPGIPGTTTGGGGGSGGGGGGGSGTGGHHASPSNATTSGQTPVSSPSNSSSISDIDQAQFEADKRAVYKHPLFSLLALLLEKCEQATQGYIPSSNSSSPNGSSNGTSDGDSFARDIQAFVQLLEKEKRPLLTNNSELDGLMIKALQVLRIHLLELEKVQELCRDFCTRYIACLRGKMQSENLLRSDYALEHNNNLSNSNSPINSPEQDLSGSAQGFYQNTDYLSANDTNEYSNMQGSFAQPPQQLTLPINPVESVPQDLSNPNVPVTAHNQFPAGLSIPPNTPHLSTQSQILGSTPLNQTGISSLPLIDPFVNGQLSPSGSSDDLDDSELDGSLDEHGKRIKRGILPKHATSVMRAWLFQHLVHPYPTEDEKRALAAQTNLTLLQVNNWFINARRRILQPMIDHNSDSSAQSPPPADLQQQSKRHWTADNFLGAVPSPSHLYQLANIENISSNVNRAAASSSRHKNPSSSSSGNTITGPDFFLHPAVSSEEESNGSSHSHLVGGR
ncbi:homeobox protein PKNOX2-like isoform X2 [Armigeres subalbatus]|uniref:homeobox protein PKNOX2-like isoform X2 n=1 Tax=Armigeres subalbatus TaxID=124917 RepID=UPI002ED149EE